MACLRGFYLDIANKWPRSGSWARCVYSACSFASAPLRKKGETNTGVETHAHALSHCLSYRLCFCCLLKVLSTFTGHSKAAASCLSEPSGASTLAAKRASFCLVFASSDESCSSLAALCSWICVRCLAMSAAYFGTALAFPAVSVWSDQVARKRPRSIP